MKLLKKKNKIKSFSVDSKKIQTAAKKFTTFRVKSTNKMKKFFTTYAPELNSERVRSSTVNLRPQRKQKFEDISQRVLDVKKLYRNLKQELTKHEKEEKLEELLDKRFKKVKRLNFEDFKKVMKNMTGMNEYELKELEFELFHKTDMMKRRQELIKQGIIHEDSSVKEFFKALLGYHSGLNQKFKELLEISKKKKKRKSVLEKSNSGLSDVIEQNFEKYVSVRKEGIKKKRYNNFVPFSELLRDDETEVCKFRDSGYLFKNSMKNLIQEYLRSNRNEYHFLEEFMEKKGINIDSVFFKNYSKQKTLQKINYKNMTIKKKKGRRKVDEADDDLEITKVSDLVKRRVIHEMIASSRRDGDVDFHEIPSFLSKKTVKGMNREDGVKIVNAYIQNKKKQLSYLDKKTRRVNTNGERLSLFNSGTSSAYVTPHISGKSKVIF